MKLYKHYLLILLLAKSGLQLSAFFFLSQVIGLFSPLADRTFLLLEGKIFQEDIPEVAFGNPGHSTQGPPLDAD